METVFILLAVPIVLALLWRLVYELARAARRGWEAGAAPPVDQQLAQVDEQRRERGLAIPDLRRPPGA